MKYVFPQNYNFKNKLFGFLDYSTAIINIIWYILIFFILKLFTFSLTIKIYFFIALCFPLFLFSILGFNHENIFYFIYYMYKFIKNRKIYFFNK